MEALRLNNVAIIGNEMALAWSDGREDYLTLEALRRACPCANCQGEPDALGRVVRPKVQYDDRSFQLMGWEIVGGYAIQPRWGDGHATGLYTYEYLRSLSQS
ncbi:MAG: DUF971 domain-containing protein [Verrucomicrobiota bacterium JB023]|nr:DUF971 domain-containing protein [Verrucomicrobiota bacterium JB023]